MQIENSVVAITGAAQGLGKAMAIRLAKSGAKIALIDINLEKLESVLADIEDADGEAIAVSMNVANEAEVEKGFAQIHQEFGQLDVLVNNAGIIRDGLLVKSQSGELVDRMSLEQWQQVIDINLTGVFLCGRAAAETMIQQTQGGVIINMSSISRAGNVGQSNYSAAKAGVAALTTTWAKELARYNIRCAAIAPGYIQTEMTQSMKPEVINKVESMIPLSRMGQGEHIAETVEFIISNDYVTGRVIDLDGGLRI
ncbi:SDR family oxidoreductase [Aliikangiella marina]|uniref:SDR family oxidoreductase n=1 Tax=Aliikangiella marina TaxID=1712262 RepID=A0A545T7G2_9GAMM|nr:SDR family oxidoreductase [Aliikangiella marina]TQV73156.1 SDR family oxidoreductase [Aliikangiella marina]